MTAEPSRPSVPKCLASLRQRSRRISEFEPAAEGDIPRFCGLSFDKPAPKHQENEDYRWLGEGERQEELVRFHLNLKEFKDELAEIVFDNSNHEMVVVFYPPVADGAKRIAKMKYRLKDLKIRVRVACRNRAQMRCAKQVIEQEELWLTKDTEYQVHERKSQGYFEVSVLRDKASAGRLRALLGDMVQVDVPEQLSWGSRH